MDVKQLHLPTARGVHDVPSETPFWGIPTATIDWCEESKSSPPLPRFRVHGGYHDRWPNNVRA